MRRAFQVVRTVVRSLLAVVLVLLVVYNAYMLVQRYVYGNTMPSVFGYASAVVVSGSMEPEISVGDMVVVRAEQAYTEGDVITFYDPNMGEYVTHRIILTSDGLYTTKGDANNSQDSFSVSYDAVVGKVVCVLRGAGAAISFFQSPAGLFTVLAAAVVIWVAIDLISYFISKRGENRQDKENEQT